MSAPYRVEYGHYYQHSIPVEILSDAITVCASMRSPGLSFPPRIIGDNVDQDCPDGLDTIERETIEEAGLR